MDKKFHATGPQLSSLLILLVGLLIANSVTLPETEVIYILSSLIQVMLLAMLLSTILIVLFVMAMWETDELTNHYYKLFNWMILINVAFIPIVLALFGTIITIRTEIKYLDGLLSLTVRCLSHSIEVIYYLILLGAVIGGSVLQGGKLISKKLTM